MSTEANPGTPPHSITIAWAATLGVLLIATWPLWTPLCETPRLAPLTPLGWVPPPLDFALLAALGLQLIGALWPRLEPARWSLATAAVTLAALMLLDQLRWQPWAYHALIAAIVLASCSSHRAQQGLRWVAIAVYAYSALAKLDAEFAATLGSQMLGVLGADSLGIATPWRERLALALPVGELALAAGLAASLKWRRLAWPMVAAAAVTHTITIGVLGPWGLGHSLGVLLWNAGFAWQTAVLFRPRPTPEPTTSSHHAWLGYAACAVAIVTPLGTPLGYWDQWPGWALYAPGGERATLFVDRSTAGRLPKGLKPFVDPPENPLGGLRRVRLGDWVLTETRAPIYPQNRVAAALTLGLIEQRRIEGGWRLVLEGPANRRTRERERREVTETSELESAASMQDGTPKVVSTSR